MGLERKDLLTIAALTADQIQLILTTAESLKEVGGRDIKKVPALRGKTVVNLFLSQVLVPEHLLNWLLND